MVTTTESIPDLGGQHVVIWLSPDGLQRFLGIQAGSPGATEEWTFSGHVAHESPGGLWLRLERIRHGDELKMETTPAEALVYFLPSVTILLACLWPAPARGEAPETPPRPAHFIRPEERLLLSGPPGQPVRPRRRRRK